jgi:hypothetical protein
MICSSLYRFFFMLSSWGYLPVRLTFQPLQFSGGAPFVINHSVLDEDGEVRVFSRQEGGIESYRLLGLRGRKCDRLILRFCQKGGGCDGQGRQDSGDAAGGLS